jgi:glycosyltransferase involved in cell wall biosynthesis
MSEKDSRIKPVFFEASTGVVSCYLKGFKCALSDNCDYIIEMDSGGSHPPSKLKEILLALDKESFDAAFMSRFMKGAGIENFPLYRRIVSKGGTVLANLWLGMKYSDATSGFEAFRADVLRKFNLDAFISRGGIYQTEMKYYCHCCNCRVKEIPFVYVGTTTAFKMKWITIALKTLFAMRFNRANVILK